MPKGSANGGKWTQLLLNAASDIDAVHLMAYDAGNLQSTGFNVIESFNSYRALYDGPIYLGIEVPPEVNVILIRDKFEIILEIISPGVVTK